MQLVSEGGGSPVLWPLVGGDQESHIFLLPRTLEICHSNGRTGNVRRLSPLDPGFIV